MLRYQQNKKEVDGSIRTAGKRENLNEVIV